MRECSKCKQSKQESEFNFRKDTQQLYRQCKACLKEANRAKYLKNRDRRIGQARAYYEKNREAKLDYARAWHYKNLDKVAVYAKKNARKLREDVFRAYGGKCACPPCGEDNLLFLTIDHVNGGGNKHRREALGSHLKAGVHTYVWLRRNGYPEGFQILCYKCNMGRWRTGGTCPHFLPPIRLTPREGE